MKYIFLPLVEKTKDEGLSRLRVRIKWNNSKSLVSFALPYLIDPSKWIKEMQRLKPNTTHGKNKVLASTINRLLDKYEDIIREIFEDLDRKGKNPSQQELKQLIDIHIKGKEVYKNDKALSQHFNDFLRERSKLNSLEASSIGSYKSVKSLLLSFCPSDNINAIDKAIVEKLYEHIISHYKSSTAIVRKMHLNLFLKYLVKKEICSKEILEIEQPRLKTIQKPIIFLTWDELMRVYNYEPLNPYEQKVKDIFLFASFTSLRYSDIKKLKHANIKNDKIEVVTQKTRKSIKIELNDYSKEILKRYPKTTEEDFIFPPFSHWRLNLAIKEIAKVCNINELVEVSYYKGSERITEYYPKHELISTHAGRKTFISNAIMMGIPPFVVMKWSGHSNYNSIKPYIEISEKAKEDAMQLFNKKE